MSEELQIAAGTAAATEEPDEAEQMALALEGEKLYVDYNVEAFNYTGERFLRDHPQRAQIAIKLIALGFGNEPIAKKVHADHRTIRELRYRCITEIEEQREELRAIVFPGVAMSADKAMELLPDVKSAKDAAITHGILRDSFMQLSGLPQAHLEVNHHIDLGSELAKLMSEAKEAMKTAKARVVGDDGAHRVIALPNGEATA